MKNIILFLLAMLPLAVLAQSDNHIGIYSLSKDYKLDGNGRLSVRHFVDIAKDRPLPEKITMYNNTFKYNYFTWKKDNYWDGHVISGKWWMAGDKVVFACEDGTYIYGRFTDEAALSENGIVVGSKLAKVSGQSHEGHKAGEKVLVLGTKIFDHVSDKFALK